MPFGLGLGELMFLLLLYALAAAGLVLAARFVLGRVGSRRSRREEIERERLAAELQHAQARIDELEAKVARVDEKASFTRELLEKPRSGG